MQDMPDASGAVARLTFSVTQTQGRELLLLADTLLFGWVRVERLELELPARAADLAPATPARDRLRRASVIAAALAIDDAGLEALLALCAPQLGAIGCEELRVRLVDRELDVGARIRAGDRVADLTMAVRLTALEQGVLLTACEPRLYGLLGRPAALLAHELLCAVTGATPPMPGQETPLALPANPAAAVVRALGEVELRPLQSLLEHALPRSGYRLPELTRTRTLGATLTRGRGTLQVGVAAAGTNSVGTSPGEQPADVRDGDQRLLAGDVDGAAIAYRRALARPSDADGGSLAQARLLDLLVSRITAADATAVRAASEASELARGLLARVPDSPIAHLALAALALADGREHEAGLRYERIMAAAEADGSDEVAVRAGLAAARRLTTSDAQRALECCARVFERRPQVTEAAEPLAERLVVQERWTELARLSRRRLAAPLDNRERTREHLRLGELLLTRLGDTTEALAQFAAAAELAPADARVWDALARAHAADHDAAQAVRALDRVAALAAARGDELGEARAHLRSGQLWEGSGDDARAHLRFRRALELVPEDLEALERVARTAGRRGHHVEATGAWSRLLARADAHDPRRGRAVLELARLDADAGRHDDARRRLAELHPTADGLALLASLEERAGRLAEAELALARAVGLAAPGNAQLELDHARVLERLGRRTEAEAALTRGIAQDPGAPAARTAASTLAESAARRGDASAEARWLDIVIGAGGELGDPPDPFVDEPRRLAASTSTAFAAAPSAQSRPFDSTTLALAGPLLRRAELALESGDGAAARRHVTAALAAADAGAPERRRAADLLGRAGDLAGRAELLRALVGEASDDDLRARLLAEASAACLAAGAPPGDALDLARAAMEFAGPTALARLALGEAGWRARSPADVLVAYAEPFPELSPPIAAEHARRVAVALELSERPVEALAAFRQFFRMPAAAGEPLATCYRRAAELERRAGDARAAAALLATAAEDDRTGDSDVTRAELQFRAAELFRKDVVDPAAATVAYEAALRHEHDHLPALDALEASYRASGNAERVATILGRKIAATTRHPERQKALLARLAAHQLDVLGRPDAAREAYLRAVALDPGYLPAHRFLAADGEQRGDDDTARRSLAWLAAEAPEAVLDTAEDRLDERASAFAALARLEHRAGRDDDADRLLDAAFALRPGRGDLLDAKEQLLTDGGRWADVCALLAARAAHASGSAEVATLAVRRARALADGSDDLAAALEVCRDALRGAPHDIALHLLHDELTLRVPTRPTAESPPAHNELTALLDAFAHAPSSAVLVNELEQRLRADGNLLRLAEVYELHAAALDGPNAAPVLSALGTLHAETFDDFELAASYHALAHGRDPAYVPALLALADYHAGAGNLSDAHDLYERSLTAVTSVDERAAIFARLGELALRAGRDVEAATRLDDALAIDPSCTAAWTWREHLLRARGEWDALADHLVARARDDARQDSRSSWLREAAALLDGPLGRAGDSRPVYAAILAIDPTDEFALARSAALDAVGLVGPATTLSTVGRAQLAAPTPTRDPVRSPAAERAHEEELALAAALAREAEGDLASAVAQLERAAALAPDDPRPLTALLRIARARGDHAEEAELLTRCIDHGGNAAERSLLLVERARLLADRLDREPEAWFALREAVALAPTLLSAVQELRRLATTRGEWALVAELLERELDACAPPERAGLHAELGLALEELLEIDGALRHLEQAVMLEPAHRAAQEALTRLRPLAGAVTSPLAAAWPVAAVWPAIAWTAAGTVVPDDEPSALERFADRRRELEAAGEHAELADLLRLRADEVAIPADRAALFFEAARLSMAHLGGAEHAAADLARAVRADPTHPAALDALADLAWQRRDLDHARALYAGLDPRLSVLGADEVLYRRGALALTLGHDDEAERALWAAVSLNATHGKAHEALALLARRRAAGPAAVPHVAAHAVPHVAAHAVPHVAAHAVPHVAAHAVPHVAAHAVPHVAAHADPVERGERALSEGDATLAATCFEQALADAPDDPALSARLADCYAAGGRWTEAADTLCRAGALEPPGKRRAALLHHAAEILLDRLGDEESATDLLLAVLENVPAHGGAVRRLVDRFFDLLDAPGLVELTRDAVAAGFLKRPDTPPATAARIAVGATLAGEFDIAAAALAALALADTGAAPHLAAALADALERHEDRVGELADAAQAITTAPGPTDEQLRAALAAHGTAAAAVLAAAV